MAFGQEYGWVPLSGWDIVPLLVLMIAAIAIPGFLLSLAIFPKRNAMPMSERLALSFGLGLTTPLVVFALNRIAHVLVTSTISLLVFAILCAVGAIGFLNRGGNANLVEWYKGKE